MSKDKTELSILTHTYHQLQSQKEQITILEELNLHFIDNNGDMHDTCYLFDQDELETFFEEYMKKLSIKTEELKNDIQKLQKNA